MQVALFIKNFMGTEDTKQLVFTPLRNHPTPSPTGTCPPGWGRGVRAQGNMNQLTQTKLLGNSMI